MRERAVTYARVSGDDRHNERRNLNGQTQMNREYCAKHSYDIVAELEEDDRGASGAAFELPRLDEARQLAEARAYDVLVVREIDRLSRNLVKQLLVEAELKDHAVRVEYVLGEYPDTPEGRLNKHIRATIAEYEREIITIRTSRARRQKVAAGNVIVNGIPPYGYRLGQVNGYQTLIVSEQEAAVVRRVFALYADGASIRSIQKQLTDERVPTAFDLRGRGRKTRGYGEWAQSAVLWLLRNETYRGVWHYGKRRANTRNGQKGQVNERATWQVVTVPALISEEEWDRVRDRLLANKDQSRRSLKYEYLLRRRLWCLHCGAKLQVSNRRGWLSYRCPAATAQRTSYAHRCSAPTFGAAQLEPKVWNWVRQLILDPAALEAGLQEQRQKAQRDLGPLQDQLASVRRRLGEIPEEERRLAGLYVKRLLSEEALDAEADALRLEAKRLTERERNLRADLASADLADDALASILDWTADIRAQLPAQEHLFAFREYIVDRLDVSVIVGNEDEVKVADVRCVLTGEEAQRLVISITASIVTPGASAIRSRTLTGRSSSRRTRSNGCGTSSRASERRGT